MAAARRGHITLAVFAGLALSVGVLVAIAGGIATRAGSRDRASVAPHRHFVQTPSGLVEVGPRVCDDPAARDAFSRFHTKVHVMAGSPRQGTVMVARGCGFTR